MPLFDLDIPNADRAYRNLRRPEHRIEAEINAALEEMWARYEPYADTNFAQQFARNPDARFWEMYLTLQLLDVGKNVRPRSDLPVAIRNTGPDIHVLDEERNVWIEAITPDSGAPANADRVPEIISIDNGGGVQDIPRRQIELRISAALLQKRNAFERYRTLGLISENDICVVAISGSRFSVQSGTMGLPLATSAVYPFGNHYVTLDRETFDVVSTGYHHSEHIERTNATPIPRYAFLDERFSQIAGLIWSRRTIGSFLGRHQDFTFVHNVSAQNSMPLNWMSWDEEEIVREIGDRYELIRQHGRTAH